MNLTSLKHNSYHCHFTSGFGPVTSINVSPSNFYPLYNLHEDGHMGGRNMYEVIMFKTISLLCSLLILLLYYTIPGLNAANKSLTFLLVTALRPKHSWQLLPSWSPSKTT
jgi:hypothetical protein